jgi:hypothetical protein
MEEQKELSLEDADKLVEAYANAIDGEANKENVEPSAQKRKVTFAAETVDAEEDSERKKREWTTVGLQNLIRFLLKNGTFLMGSDKKDYINMDVRQFAGCLQSFDDVLSMFMASFGVEKEDLDETMREVFLRSTRQNYVTLNSLGNVFSAWNIKLWLQSKHTAGSLPFIIGGMTAQMRNKALEEILGNEVQKCSAEKWMDRLEADGREDVIQRICAHIYKQCNAAVSKVEQKPCFEIKKRKK